MLPKVSDNEIVKSKVFIRLLSLFFISLITYIYFYGFKLYQGSSVDSYRESTAYLYYGVDLMVPAVIIAFILRRKSPYFKVIFFSMLFISMYIFMGLYARYRFIAMILSIFFLYYIQKDKRPKVFNVLLTIPLVLIGFALTGIFRGILKTGIDFRILLEAIKNEGLILRFLSSQGDAAMFDFLVLYFQEIPKNINYLYGLGFLQIFIHPIPRIIWESKPIQPSAYFMSEILPKFYKFGVGFASSIFGDLYWNFGLIGIIVGMFLTGLFLKTVYLWFIKNKDILSFQIIYAFSLSFLPMYMRGEFVGTSVWFLFALVPALIIFNKSKKNIKLTKYHYHAG
jgi:oligosaccharide repeat unit polymerase